MRPELLVALAALFLGWPAQAAESGGSPRTEDPWIGKPRSDIVAILGEPDKAKRSAAGTEAMVYKMFVVGADVEPRADMVLVDLPGIGPVGRILPGPSESEESITIEPSGLDESGRPTGGLTRSRSYETSVELGRDKAKPPRTEATPEPKRRGKIKVTFELGPDGRVETWIVSPKKRAGADE
jgi:hypothetical protein